MPPGPGLFTCLTPGIRLHPAARFYRFELLARSRFFGLG